MCAGSSIKHAGQMVDSATARNVNCCQIIAALEHIHHIITVIQVFQPSDALQTIAISEHFFHCGDIRQIPVSQIYISHLDVVFEHITHIRDIRRVNFSVSDSCQSHFRRLEHIKHRRDGQTFRLVSPSFLIISIAVCFYIVVPSAQMRVI